MSVENIGGCEAAMDMCPTSEIQTVFRGHRARVKMKQAMAEQRATECRTGAEPALTIRLSQPEAGMRTELTVTFGMQTRLDDMNFLLQRLPDMDSSLAKQSSLLEASLVDGEATAEMITEQHDDGERAHSGLGERVAMEFGGGGPYDEAMLHEELDNCKCIRKKWLARTSQIIVQPA